MTLDEAIEHAEEMAKIHCVLKNKYNQKCAEEHRQLAEWLKDYKRLLAIESGIDVRCGNCKHDGIDSDRCEECYWYNKWEEVKSDEETKRP